VIDRSIAPSPPRSSNGRLVAVVGAGPAGIFAASFLLELGDVSVDIFDRDSTPFGLVRYGVAPDHLKIRSVARALAKVLGDPRVTFRGNVEVGRDVTVEELRARYHAVLVATGAPHGRRLDIAGRDLPGHVASSDLIGWYNDHPNQVDRSDRTPVTGSSAVIVGAGNVALDVARILLKGRGGLQDTDVSRAVLDSLPPTGMAAVHIVARRGITDAKFTLAELRELDKLDDLAIAVDPGDTPLHPADTEQTPDLRLVLFRRWHDDDQSSGGAKSLMFHFGLTPTAIVGPHHVRGLELLASDGRSMTLPADTIVSCIGFAGVPIPGLPHDPQRTVIPNEGGRIAARLYVTGWAKRGPSGVIGTNKACAAETVAALASDFESNARGADDVGAPAPGVDAQTIDELLAARGLRWTTWQGWQRIECAEQALGRSEGRTRSKIRDFHELVDLGAADLDPITETKGDTS